jgi:hypothetical protein
MSWSVIGFGVVLLLAGLYQFRDSRLGGLRIVGVIDSDVDTDDASEPERVFAKLVGVGLILLALFFLWIGGAIPLGEFL